MKRGGILHPGMCHLLASTGHTDYFTVCDRGFPVPIGPERIDLALTDDVPRVLDVLRAIDAEFVIDRIIVAEEADQFANEHVAALRGLREGIVVETVPHLELKHLSQQGRATIRTGDTTPYANIIVVSG
jgi:D-ribose pyranase